MDTDDVAKILQEAAEAVSKSKIPDDLRQIAFDRALDLIAGAPEPPPPGDDAPPPGGQDDRLSQIAANLGVDRAAVEEVFEVEDDELHVVVPPGRLDGARSRATEQLALLVTAGRQTGGWEDWTDVAVVREAARDFGKLDESNFAGTIKEMTDPFRQAGGRRDRRLKLNRNGRGEATELVRQLSS